MDISVNPTIQLQPENLKKVKKEEMSVSTYAPS
jgi:hypothetical protein